MYKGGPNDGKGIPHTHAPGVAIIDKDSIALYERDAEGNHVYKGNFTRMELANMMKGGTPPKNQQTVGPEKPVMPKSE